MSKTLNVQTVVDEPSLRTFLDELEEQLQAVSRTLSEMAFVQYQTKRRPEGMAEAENAQAAIMSNADYQEVVGRFAGTVEEPRPARRVEMWFVCFGVEIVLDFQFFSVLVSVVR